MRLVANAFKFLMAGTLVLAPAQANMFNRQDHALLSSLSSRLRAVDNDTIAAGKSASQSNDKDAAACLLHMQNEMFVFEHSISIVEVLLDLSSVMRDRADEAKVNHSLASAVKKSLEFLALSRAGINYNVGRCGTIAIVVNKAQLILSLFDNAQSVLSSLNKRL